MKVAIQDQMKCDKDMLFRELMEKWECNLQLEDVDAAVCIVQARAGDKHMHKLIPWKEIVCEMDTESKDED